MDFSPILLVQFPFRKIYAEEVRACSDDVSTSEKIFYINGSGIRFVNVFYPIGKIPTTNINENNHFLGSETKMIDIYSNTGSVLFQFKIRDKIFEILGNSFKEGTITEKRILSGCDELYAIIDKIEIWKYLFAIKPYIPVIPHKEFKFYMHAHEKAFKKLYFEKKHLMSVQKLSNGIKFEISKTGTSGRRGDHDGWFEHTVSVYKARAYKSFVSMYDMEMYLYSLQKKGFYLNFINNSFNIQLEKSISEIAGIFDITFEFWDYEYDEPCDYE